MDDKEKSLFENFADTVKHTFDVATDAAKKELEPEPLKPDEKIVVVPAADAVGTDFLGADAAHDCGRKTSRKACSSIEEGSD
jgi:hypothetical protein